MYCSIFHNSYSFFLVIFWSWWIFGNSKNAKIALFALKLKSVIKKLRGIKKNNNNTFPALWIGDSNAIKRLYLLWILAEWNRPRTKKYLFWINRICLFFSFYFSHYSFHSIDNATKVFLFYYVIYQLVFQHILLEFSVYLSCIQVSQGYMCAFPLYIIICPHPFSRSDIQQTLQIHCFIYSG